MRRLRSPLLRDRINSVVIAHGLFSLLDASRFQHPEAPALNVSVPMPERPFGQGAKVRFDNAVVTIEDRTKPVTTGAERARRGCRSPRWRA